MDLEVKNIFSSDFDTGPEDSESFVAPIYVEIGEKGKPGTETFHFVVASPKGLVQEVENGRFNFLRGYILMPTFDWAIIHRAIQSLIDHARSRNNWDEVISYLNRYGRYDSEDLEGRHYP
jgi:hypothetical protein